MVIVRASILCLLIAMGISSCSNEVDLFKSVVNDSSIELTYDGKTLLAYNHATLFPHDTLPDYYKRSGFIHPIKTLSGKVISDGFPRGHTHQHALFNAWTRSTFRGHEIDFWNQQAEQGIVRHKSILNTSKNGFNVALEHIALIDGDSIVALDETWKVTTSVQLGYYYIDVKSVQSCHGKDTLHINKYHYGGFAFRGSDEWNYKNNYDSLCYFTTNEKLNQIAANHSKPKWASMYGYVEGDLAGIGIIPHPSNFRYPQHIRVHPSMPYYCFIPAVDEGFAIVPGQDYVSKFRLIVFDGEIDAAVMQNELGAFAEI